MTAHQHKNCKLNKAPNYQCCCQCIYHKAVSARIEDITVPIGPDDKYYKTSGYACIRPDYPDNMIMANWPEHDVGCGLYRSTATDPLTYEHNKIQIENKNARDNVLAVGRFVMDQEGYSGVITQIEDRHNVHVELANGGKGIYCQVKDCKDYDPLTLFVHTKKRDL
jgi:hypothetical protein